MNGLIAGFGLGLLIALASAVAVAADRDARNSAWRRIASSRRINHEEAARLQAWGLDLAVRERALAARTRRLETHGNELGADARTTTS